MMWIWIRVPLYGYVLCLIFVILMLIPYDSGLQKTIEHKGKKTILGPFLHRFWKGGRGNAIYREAVVLPLTRGKAFVRISAARC